MRSAVTRGTGRDWSTRPLGKHMAAPLHAPYGKESLSDRARAINPIGGRALTRVKPMPAADSLWTARQFASGNFFSSVNNVPSTSDTTSSIRDRPAARS